MARINIDDGLDQDARFRALCRKVGSDYEALGRLVRFWQIAQDYWGDEKALVPAHIFKLESFQPILEFGLAEEREDGFYACGAEERFAWYLDLCRHNRHQNELQKQRREAKRLEADEKARAGSRPGPVRGTTAESKADPMYGPPPSPSPSPLKKKKSNPPPPASSPDPIDLAIADDWVGFARSRSDTVKPDRVKYADAVRQMRGLGLTADDIQATLAWIRSDDFWSKVAWSPVQLVKSKGGSRKLDQVRAQMAKSKPPTKKETLPVFSSEEELDAYLAGR